MSRHPLGAPLACVALALSFPAFAAAPDEEAAYLRMTLPDEELVESATRAPKPLTQVAENVTVVTAEEIEAMNAHTLAEVLNRVTGVFVRPLTGGTFGDVSILGIQGSVDIHNSTAWHVTLLLDGVPWTQVGSGAVLVNTVPVGIIDRIEIVKGPASSTWGAALGGVVNVLTKKAGTNAIPRGAAQGSYGERRTYDTRAEAAGAAGPVGYYLQAGAQGAEWESTDTDYWAKNLFGKVEVKAAPALTLGFTMAASHPEYSDEHSAPWSGDYDYPTGLALLSADARLSSDVTLHVAGFLERIGQDGELSWDGSAVPDWGVAPPEGEPAFQQRAREKNRGLSGHLVWAAESHTLTFGADYFKGRVENSFENGPTVVDAFGLEPAGDSSTFTERWGLYVNDTVRLGPLAVTPGLRFDDANRSEGFWSPSLGATLRLGASTLLRGQVARGFSTPPVDYLAGSATLPANPDLDNEKVWSWQGGVETVAVPGLLLKVTAFRHEATDSLEADPDTGEYVNWPQVWRQGFEAEAETASFAGLSATGGFAWAHIKKVGTDRSEQDQYQANLGLRYKRGTFLADLGGHFVWWDLGPGWEEGDHNDFLWDLAASKTVLQLGPVDLDLFGGVHNLFNGKQYSDGETNPSRWVEGGARIRF